MAHEAGSRIHLRWSASYCDMRRQRSLHLSDIRGAVQIAADILSAATAEVESLARTVLARVPGGVPGALLALMPAQAAGWVLQRVGAALPSGNGMEGSGRRRETVAAILNGLIGDHLAASGNPLAIPMQLRRRGRAIEFTREGLEAAVPRAGPRVLIMVHGLGCSDWQWRRKGHDHGIRLARDLGYTTLYLNYNTGCHISVNGRAFSLLLERLVANWPVKVEEIAIVAHSMGGLVARSAHHYGEQEHKHWPRMVKEMIFLGTPHHGAPPPW